MLRQALLLLARSQNAKTVVTRMPVSSSLVNRYVPGEETGDAVAASRRLIDDGLHVTLDFLGEDTLDQAQAEATVEAYLELLEALGSAGLARNAEVSVKLSAIGQALPEVGPKLSEENARRICRAARDVGTTVTLDMEDHTTTDHTLAT
ncbi:MAG TPA: proline dehydrogenase family protein, partial [Marmoricola sp.]|nr:proline dehydrogenase family protein [Marmoricola sp.]